MNNLYQEKWTHMLNLFRLFFFSSTILRLSVHHKLENKESSQIYCGKLDKFKRSIYSKVFLYGSADKESAHSVGDLGWEDPLGTGKATYSSILSKDCIMHGVTKSRTWVSDFHLLTYLFQVWSQICMCARVCMCRWVYPMKESHQCSGISEQNATLITHG